MLVRGCLWPGEVLVLGDPRVRHRLARLVDDGDLLEPLPIVRLVPEGEAAIGEPPEAVAEELVHGAGKDRVADHDPVAQHPRSRRRSRP